ncbi:MAG: hypothetical protein A2Y77_07685 [Planctomycetes bacterium RBG_13_62_9]|nr:MAG: hypothetical protein A2Y77_07685 [Planctomycetes bacterium RBG_13_62_9]
MKALRMRILLVCLIGQVLAVSGCYNCASSLARCAAKYKGKESMVRDFGPDSSLTVHNEAGSITVSAEDTTDCRIEAKVYVLAPTKGEARDIGEGVRIRAEPKEGTLLVTVDKPPLSGDRHVWVDFDIVIPAQECADRETGSEVVAGPGARGSLDLRTDAGRITCREITSGRITARSDFGPIDISCSEACPGDVTADVEASFGRIRFKAPPDYQGAIDLETDFGSVKSRTAVVDQVEKSRDSLKGTTGGGRGNLRLHTSFGSVRVR